MRAPRSAVGVISGTSSPGTGPAPSAKLTMYASVPTCTRHSRLESAHHVRNHSC